MTKDKLAIVAALVFLSLTVAACARSHPPEKNSSAPAANQTNSNASTPEEAAAIQAAAASPFFKQTVRGDIERAGFEVEKALAAGSRADWQNAEAILANAKANVETGLGRDILYSQRVDLEELKSAIDRTIRSIADRSDDANKQIQELRTRIMALKVQIPDS